MGTVAKVTNEIQKLIYTKRLQNYAVFLRKQ